MLCDPLHVAIMYTGAAMLLFLCFQPSLLYHDRDLEEFWRGFLTQVPDNLVLAESLEENKQTKNNNQKKEKETSTVKSMHINP